MRLMDDYVKEMDRTLAIANWEMSVGKKDGELMRKRQEQDGKEGKEMMNKLAKELRIEKLKQLFKEEEAMYEEELTARGLTFRKERI